MHCTGAATMALDDLLATLERQCGTSGTSGVLADVPAKPAPTLGGTSGTSGTSENGEGKAQAEAFTAWLLHFTDRESFEVHFSPPATLAEVLTGFPTAINAEPMQAPHGAEPDPDKAQPHQEEKAPPAPDAGRWRAGPAALPARSCRTCRHLKRPGLSDGHCGGRDDLPAAYGPGHPLRRLPDDRGASCATWELAT